jgi:hypothetical protein
MPPGTDATDPARGKLMVWGATLRELQPVTHQATCSDSPVLRIQIAAGSESVFLAWAVRISDDAAEISDQLDVSVSVEGVGEQTLTIQPVPQSSRAN